MDISAGLQRTVDPSSMAMSWDRALCASLLLSSLFFTTTFAASAHAEPDWSDTDTPSAVDEAPSEDTSGLDALEWMRQGFGALGGRARLRIPEGYRFGATETAVTLLRAMGNVPDGTELALVGPDDLDWFVIYDFEDIGYVKDDEKDDLDADELLSNFRDMAEQANAIRQERGLPTFRILGWAVPPHYDEASKVLEWATKAEFTDPRDGTTSVSVNYKTKVLGRHGVMNVVVVCGVDELSIALPAYRDMMKGFEFVEGERYAEYKAGDKVATYGLAALMLGGATAVAAKTGLLASLLLLLKKGGKAIVLGAMAVVAFIGRFFAGLFGRGTRED